ncbi:von Willebrand factor type A [Ignisphaera aggregans DSM 17230]|uniref:von Willebrand factor type A n=1 Tax=Ignisphaera aggregans (strain DSM 17230 / JCM 13409 / AQ1.S1) TaxID=583356 RepID=E0SSR8_IGNAA|nr:von Willebrand factor type A [Ignisphaera aggregans DSM 17230]
MSIYVEPRLAKLFVVEGKEEVIPFVVRIRGVGSAKTRSIYLIAIDSSWSMDGEKIFFAKDAILNMVRMLDPDDYISLYSFCGKVHKVLDFIRIRDMDRIVKAVAGIKLGGGTNTYGVLEQIYMDIPSVLDRVKKEESDKIPSIRMIMVTDGNPTVGIRDEDRIIDIAERLGKYLSISLIIGVGDDYNERLLAKIALKTKGFFEHLDNPAKTSSILENMVSRYKVVSARDVELYIKPSPGIGVYIYNKPYYTSGGGVGIEIGDVYEGENIDVVGEFIVSQQKKGLTHLATITATYIDESGVTKEVEPKNIVIPCVSKVSPGDIEMDENVFKEINLIRIATTLAKDMYGGISVNQLNKIIEELTNSTIAIENRELYMRTIDLRAQLEKEGLSPDMMKKLISLITRILSGRYYE